MVSFSKKLLKLIQFFLSQRKLTSLLVLSLFGFGIYFQIQYLFEPKSLDKPLITESAKASYSKSLDSSNSSLSLPSLFQAVIALPKNYIKKPLLLIHDSYSKNLDKSKIDDKFAYLDDKTKLSKLDELAIKADDPTIPNTRPKSYIWHKDYKIKTGDTLGGILMAGTTTVEDGSTNDGLGPNKLEHLTNGFYKLLHSKHIYPGQMVRYNFEQNYALIDASLVRDPLNSQLPQNQVNKLIAIDLYLDDKNYIHADLDGETIEFTKLAKPSYLEYQAREIDINNSLYLAAKEANIPEDIIYQLTELFSFNIDFQREIYPKDKFILLYQVEKLLDNDMLVGKNKLFFASLKQVSKKKPLNYYLYKKEIEGKEIYNDFFDENGKSAKRQLVKTPVEAKRISSRFGMRKHPILGFTKMHTGVDFPVPTNTPIKAAGDGVVTFVGRNGGFGKHVVIRHNSTYTTSYSHLNKYRSKLRKGVRVSQGDIIAYSGNTGRSTGPHLHYEVKKYSKPVNPLTLNLPNSKTLKGEEFKDFSNLVANYEAIYASKNDNIKRSRIVVAKR